jgi:hypothetical protein
MSYYNRREFDSIILKTHKSMLGKEKI